ncbi:hypothetical protein [Methanobrevibacter sp.]|uniref:hypothetical protein n=1 Tax=Methanobrevibacter sp. TaxID=66852 RepID=UPI00388EAE7E
MPSVTAYPSTITQTSGGNFQTFSNLNNLKNASNTYAKTGKIAGKTGTKKRPSTITCTNFQISLPVGAEPTSITIEYAHQKLDDTKDKYPSIAAPTIHLKNSGVSPVTYVTKQGSTPTKDLLAKTATFNGKVQAETVVGTTTQTVNGITTTVPKFKTTTVYYDMPSRNAVQSSNFGVVIDYPANTSANTGYLQLKYIRIKVNYKLTTYGISVSKMSSDDVYADTTMGFQVELTNINQTAYATNVLITLPPGTVIDSVTGNVGDFIQWDQNQYVWKPPQSKDFTTRQLLLFLKFTEGNKTITVLEKLNNTTSHVDFTVYPQRIYSSSNDNLFGAESILYSFVNTEFTLPIKLAKDFIESTDLTAIYIFNDRQMTVNGFARPDNGSTAISLQDFDEDGYCEVPCSCPNEGEYLIGLNTSSESPEAPTFLLRIAPTMGRQLEVAILELSEEETDRLGDGEVYTVNTDLILYSDETYYYHDYYRNDRIGVVNTIAETDDKTAILNACNHFSDGMTTINHWEEKNVEFTYDKTYPVYILFVGNAINDPDYEKTSINFTHPNLFLSEDEYTPEVCILPTPLENLINDNGIASVDVPIRQSTNQIIFKELGFDQDFGTNENYAIRGLGLILECESNGQIVANAKIKSPSGLVGQQSTIITPNKNIFYIGGEYDLWGFNISNMEDLSDWTVELNFGNVYSNNESKTIHIEMTSLKIVAYYLEMDNSNVHQIYVEDENLEWYNVFIKDWKSPSGIKTNVKYLNVDGTDINDATNQTIKEKEIEIEFDIDGCDLTESTSMLQQVTRLLTNKRNELNKPIPKIVRSSFEPNVFYEYILEEGIDAQIKISGYECKVKLTVPAGTNYAIDDTVTNASGVVNSIARVNPTIIVVPQADTIELLEEHSEQKFQAGRSDWIGKYVEIDCENRIVWLRENEEDEPVNISSSADFNVDWFNLDGAYNFLPSNCIIQTVTFTERG